MGNIKDDNEALLKEYLETKSKDSFDKLVISNLKLISFVMKKVRVSPKRWDDYYDVGELALIKAIKTYDKKYLGKCSFSTFAIKCIKTEIWKQYREEKGYFETLSLDYEAYEDDARDSFYDTVSFSKYLSFGDEVDDYIDNEYKEYIKKILYKILNKCNERDREIFLSYFGLNGPAMNQIELAEKYGVTRSEISRRYNRTMEKVKDGFARMVNEDGDIKMEKNSCKKPK